MKTRFFLLLSFWFCCVPTLAAIDSAPEFTKVEQQELYQRLSKEIRCPTCQNQDVSDSNAPLARQLRERIAEFVRDGKNYEEITAELTARYGDFITYNPPLRPATFILWFGPFIFMVFSLLFLIYYQNKRKKRSDPLSQEERLRLERILQHYDEHDS